MSNYNPYPQPKERRLVFTDPVTGEQKVKVTTPRGKTIIRIEQVGVKKIHTPVNI